MFRRFDVLNVNNGDIPNSYTLNRRGAGAALTPTNLTSAPAEASST